MMQTVLQDIRFAIRLFLKNPGFSMIVVFTLAAGIAVNTAIFSLVNAVLLRQLSYKDPERLVWIWSSRTDRDKSPFSLPDFMDYSEQNRTLKQISAFSAWNATLFHGNEPERISGVHSSANVFQMLGIHAEIGRTLLAQDDNPARSEERRVGKECRSRWSPYH